MRAITIAALLSAALVTLAAGLSEPLLDLLDVSPPTFRVAAGVVLAVAGIRWVVVGARPIVDDEPLRGRAAAALRDASARGDRHHRRGR